MSKKESVVALFGGKVIKDPLFIDTDSFISQENASLNKQKKPNVMAQSMGRLFSGSDFLKISDSIEPYLKAIFLNQHSQKKLFASIAVANRQLEINVTNKIDLDTAIKNEVKPSVKSKMTLKPSPGK